MALLLMGLWSFAIEKSDYKNITQEELVSRIHEGVDQLDKFKEGFEEGFNLEREIIRADRIDFFGDALAIAFYLFILVGASALIGWFCYLFNFLATSKKGGSTGIIFGNRDPTISRKYLVGVVVKNDLGLNLLSLSK